MNDVLPSFSTEGEGSGCSFLALIQSERRELDCHLYPTSAEAPRVFNWDTSAYLLILTGDSCSRLRFRIIPERRGGYLC